MTLAHVLLNDTWMDFVATRRAVLRDELITHYTPLVRFVVGRLGIPSTPVLDSEDLVSFGIIGLINAVDRFDPTRGVRFEAFATARIRGAVIDQLRSLNWLPRSAVARVKQVETALSTLEQRLGRPAREDEAAQELGMTLERYRQTLMEVGLSMLSLEAPLSMFGQDDELLTLRDLLEDQATLSPDDAMEKKEMLVILRSAIEHLPEREQVLLSLYYVEEMTMKEISKIMEVSESRICQLHTQALVRLRTIFAEWGDERSRKKLKTTVSSTRRSNKVAS